MRSLALGVFALGVLGSGAARAACPDDGEIGRFVADMEARRPAKALMVETPEDARCAQEKLVAALAPILGAPVGFKAGLTSKPAQERFGATGPVSGVLLEKMILADGATVPASYGARPVWEADMLLVVKDAGINAATTPEELLEHVAGMRPFIELADLALAEGEPVGVNDLQAINVGARLGVAGADVPLDGSPETLDTLTDAKIVATDQAGAVLAESTGAATLGSPAHAALWLVEDLKASGRKLEAGDLISVGSFTPLTPPKPGQEITVRYEGLPGNPQVSVRFE